MLDQRYRVLILATHAVQYAAPLLSFVWRQTESLTGEERDCSVGAADVLEHLKRSGKEPRQ